MSLRGTCFHCLWAWVMLFEVKVYACLMLWVQPAGSTFPMLVPTCCVHSEPWGWCLLHMLHGLDSGPQELHQGLVP